MQGKSEKKLNRGMHEKEMGPSVVKSTPSSTPGALKSEASGVSRQPPQGSGQSYPHLRSAWDSAPGRPME